MSSAADWAETRRRAHELGAAYPLVPTILRVDAALGRVAARDLHARATVPSWDAAAMDGWAVAGSGPWSVLDAIHAGEPPPAALQPGTARPIATGAPVPAGTGGILRLEHGRVIGGRLQPTPGHADAPPPGAHIRRRGEELHEGDLLLPAGVVLTAARIALAASAGYSQLAVSTRPTVEFLVLGDELRSPDAPPVDGSVVDVLSLVLPALAEGLGSQVLGIRRLPDETGVLSAALADSAAELVVTTGGTGPGRRDHVAAALAGIGVPPLVHGVAMRPGHPVLLASRGTSAVLGLPGNPLAAVATFLSFAPPFLRARAGLPAETLDAIVVAETVANPTDGVRLAVVDALGRLTAHQGSAMLRGLATGIGFAIVPAGGAEAGQSLPLLPLTA